jgi:hypothetical protein
MTSSGLKQQPKNLPKVSYVNFGNRQEAMAPGETDDATEQAINDLITDDATEQAINDLMKSGDLAQTKYRKVHFDFVPDRFQNIPGVSPHVSAHLDLQTEPSPSHVAPGPMSRYVTDAIRPAEPLVKPLPIDHILPQSNSPALVRPVRSPRGPTRPSPRDLPKLPEPVGPRLAVMDHFDQRQLHPMLLPRGTTPGVIRSGKPSLFEHIGDRIQLRQMMHQQAGGSLKPKPAAKAAWKSRLVAQKPGTPTAPFRSAVSKGRSIDLVGEAAPKKSRPTRGMAALLYRNQSGFESTPRASLHAGEDVSEPSYLPLPAALSHGIGFGKLPPPTEPLVSAPARLEKMQMAKLPLPRTVISTRPETVSIDLLRPPTQSSSDGAGSARYGTGGLASRSHPSSGMGGFGGRTISGIPAPPAGSSSAMLSPRKMGDLRVPRPPPSMAGASPLRTIQMES